jgi:hypothetical protein
VKISKGERTVTTSVPVIAIDLEGAEVSELLASLATLGGMCCSHPAECGICAPAKRFASAVRAA